MSATQFVFAVLARRSIKLSATEQRKLVTGFNRVLRQEGKGAAKEMLKAQLIYGN